MPLADFNLLTPLGLAMMLAMIGCLLIVAEVLIPSGGIIGFFATCSLIASIYYAYQAAGVTGGLGFGLGLVVVVPLLLISAFKVLPHTPMGRAMLGSAPREEDVLVDDPRHALVGRVGVARSKMLPSGAVEIDGQMIDAVSQGRAIDPGQYVKVVEVRGNRVMVRPAGEGDRPANPNADDLLARPIEELGIDSLEDPLA
ncbi:hypothetical protein Pla123a_31260 [Posidoniimonas polymericola]|uniref:NfeD-like C-terminal domain-containing protein n=1 Tax=Posidoniimonas polymericola TaxID=2528002 RepID=A0A5C5YL68_9BACT|nr:NfeD family protein [Posidoniimonas polymericola]TWT75616.1 hypothetical protein Pla123a_31260 [Posidoniimonas polymericola]